MEGDDEEGERGAPVVCHHIKADHCGHCETHTANKPLCLTVLESD